VRISTEMVGVGAGSHGFDQERPGRPSAAAACGYGSPSKVGMARASPSHTAAGAENDGSVR
jgi:hypothetical protein